MKTKLNSYLLLPFFALFLFVSCQDEVTEITETNNEEVFTAESELANLLRSTSTKDGSADNIIDKANGLTVDLPVTVFVNGQEITVNSIEDFSLIEANLDANEDDEDNIEIQFPITIILPNHTEVVINNQDELNAFVAEHSSNEEEEDDDIECIDFVYPLTFSIYNASFQVIETVVVNNDKELYRFIENLDGVLASLNFPVTLKTKDGETFTVNNNIELARTLREARGICDEDDDNDHNDDDFTKERLDNLLISCPWIVKDVRRDNNDLANDYREYIIVFNEDGTAKVRARNGDMLTGVWETRVTERGAKITLEFDSIVDFTLDWFVYEIEPGKIKLFTEEENRIILKKNCDIVVDHTIDRVKNFLKECLWRVARLHVDGADNERAYIGTPLKFFDEGIVKIRVEGEFLQGTWDVLEHDQGLVLQINLEGRPDLQLEWLITLLEEDLIKLESLGNQNNKLVLKRHCPDGDEDVTYINNVLNEGEWQVAHYEVQDGILTQEFSPYVIDFLESGLVKVTNPNLVSIAGSWLVYRGDLGLMLGLNFGNEPLFKELNHRWKIAEVSENRIELKDLSTSGEIERVLVFERL